MENLSRESILRMVGLHDSAQFMRQVNAIQMTLEQQGSDMVAYWTEIRKDERQISLIAGRVSANETSIGQLQIQAYAISLSVQSLSTTVNGDGTQGSGLVSRVSSLELTANSIDLRVEAIEDDYVTSAEISLMVVKDANGYISNASIKADNILFTFTQNANFISNNTTVMSIDTSGNLWISGEYKGGSITGNITIGTGTNKMYIQPNATGGANLIGKRGSTEVINLGFDGGSGATTSANGILTLGESGDYQTEIHSHFLQIRNGYSSPYVKAQLWTNELIFAEGSAALGITFGVSGTGNSRKIVIRTQSINEWPSLSDVNVGQVYIDNGYLKVRTS